MKKNILLLVLAILCSCSTFHVQAQNISARIVKDSIFIPWEIIWGPDDNIWLTQKNGYICRLHPATGVLDTLYHEAATVIQSEGGMLGLALHPQFATQPYVYAVYDYLQGTSYRERLVRYTYNGSNALGSPAILFDNVTANVNHNGSRLCIVGDKIFMTTGDALTMPNAQNLSSPNGKIHRLNLDGTIPADNPIAGSSLWSWGHRNPQGLVFANGFLYSSEHGNTTDDEINIIQKGRNYGWPTVEGFCDKPAEMQFCTDSNVKQPLHAWTPTLAVCGTDYYSQRMFPMLQGSLIMCTLKDQHLYQLKLSNSKDSITSATIIAGVGFGRLRDVCISPEGRIYISTSNSVSSGASAKIDRIVELYDPAYSNIPTPPGKAFALYPNPVKNELHISGLKTATAYTIRNAVGQVMMKGTADAGNAEIKTSALLPGAYTIQTGNDTGQLFIKE